MNEEVSSVHVYWEFFFFGGGGGGGGGGVPMYVCGGLSPVNEPAKWYGYKLVT